MSEDPEHQARLAHMAAIEQATAKLEHLLEGMDKITAAQDTITASLTGMGTAMQQLVAAVERMAASMEKVSAAVERLATATVALIVPRGGSAAARLGEHIRLSLREYLNTLLDPIHASFSEPH